MVKIFLISIFFSPIIKIYFMPRIRPPMAEQVARMNDVK